MIMYNSTNPFDSIIKEIKAEILNSNDVENIFAQLKNHCYVTPTCIDEILDNIDQIIFNLSIEVLISEYHILREKNLLHGNDRNERINSFYKIYACDSNYAIKILEKYPIMKRIIKFSVHNYLQENYDIIVRYRDDYRAITTEFQQDFGFIKSISISNGDTHYGRSVAILYCQTGKLVYKPHSLLTDEFYSNLVDLINNISERDQISLPSISHIKALYRKNYGWTEFVQNSKCSSENNLHEFYTRCGMHLALFYVLGTIDVHYENIIACDDTPYFIDLETLITAERSNYFNLYEGKMINDSVLSSNMLPAYIGNTAFDIIISALFTPKERSSKIKQSILISDDLLDWAYKTQYFEIEIKEDHRSVDNHEFDIRELYQDIIYGFKTTLEIIVANKKIFCDKFNLFSNIEIAIRQILRPTHVYSQFLSAARLPQNLTSQSKYNSVFEILLDSFKLSGYGYIRVLDEIEQLKNGNIPYYYTYINSRDLYSDGKILCENFFVRTPQDTVQQRLKLLDKNMISYQVRFIEMSMLSILGIKELENHKSEINLTSEKINIESIKKYMLSLNKNLIYQNNDAVFIVMPYIKNHRFEIQPIEPELYNYGGIIHLYMVYGMMIDYQYLDIAQKMLNPLNSYILKSIPLQKNMPNFSVFNGIGSLCYLNYNMYKITKSPLYEDYLYEIFNLCITHLENSMKPHMVGDYLNGESGLIYLLVKIYSSNTLKNKIFLPLFDKLKNVCDLYINAIHDQKFICDGIAHGKSGYAVALSEIYKSFGNNNAKELSLKLMSDVSTDIEDYSWCKGRFGIYLAQYIVGYNTKCCLNRLDCKFYYSELKKMCENESRTCICHGTVGAFDCMLSIVHKFDFKLMDMYNMALQGQTLDCLKTFKTARYQYESFMLGTAGIVYTSLRLFYKAPSLILLDLL